MKQSQQEFSVIVDSIFYIIRIHVNLEYARIGKVYFGSPIRALLMCPGRCASGTGKRASYQLIAIGLSVPPVEKNSRHEIRGTNRTVREAALVATRHLQ